MVLMMSVVTAQAVKPVKVACVGNSITQGATISNEHRDSYPGVLGQMLGEGYEVRNYGFSGRTLLDKGDRPYMKETMYQQALAFEPDIVTIKLGTNDTKPFNWVYEKEFPDNLRTMVKAFQALPSHPKIYLCYPVPAYRLDWGINDSIIRTGVQAYINQIAAECGTEIIDLYTPFVGKPELYNDQIHPTREGAFDIAKILYKTLTGKEVDPSFRPQEYPGIKGTWEGYDCYSFNFKERQGKIVVPHQMAEGRPWIWRPAFFGAYPSVDKALLEKGYFVVFFDMADEFASPASLKDGDQLYKYLTKQYGLAKKMTIEGFSRGGMYAINWAADYPHKVACLYLDAPVCDVNSWPGSDRPEWKKEWQDFLKVWDIDGAQAVQFENNPLSKVEALHSRQIPVVIVAAKKDKVVPFKENAASFAEKYQAVGGEVKLIVKKKGGHHPHSLENPAEIVDFIVEHTAAKQ